MTIVVFTPPATEPLSVAEVLAHCQIDASNQEPPPGVITVAIASPAAPGNVNAGAHRYLATFMTADGETQAGPVSAAVTVVDAAVNGKVTLTSIQIGSGLTTARKLYRTAAGGTHYLLLATIANNTDTTYTDNIADASLGAEAPTVNTTTDPFLGMLISGARQAAETELHRALITQTLDLYLDCFPGQEPYWTDLCRRRFEDGHGYEIKTPSLKSVTSINYVDTNGVQQTLAVDQYLVDTKACPARIAPAYGVFWPIARQQNNAVTVRFVDGYGTAADVPARIKQWMLMYIRTAWEPQYRAALVAGERGFSEIPTAHFDGLLDGERIFART